MLPLPAKRALLATCLALLTALSLVAQYGRGVILGTITDPSGAVVPGVKVTATNIATNEAREFTSDAGGNFQFNAMPSGFYNVTATGASFKTATASKVELRVNSQLRVDMVMLCGGVSY